MSTKYDRYLGIDGWWEVPEWIRDAIALVQPASQAPAATPEPPPSGGPAPVDRGAYPIVLGWELEGSNWRYDASVSGQVASIPVREGCESSRFGDRAFFVDMVTRWGRGRMVLTPLGIAFMLGEV